MPKRTFQPKKRRKARKHGFFARAKKRNGKRIIKRRRGKGRQRLTH